MIYWMMKEDIANVKFEGLLQLTERLGVCDMRLFGHCSHSSVQEMVLEIYRQSCSSKCSSPNWKCVWGSHR